MFYDFAEDMTLNETREIVRKHNEALGVTAFIEADRGDYVIFNYVVSFDGSFPDFTGDPIRDREIAIIRECRGITFDKDTGRVAIRKFHKFFNVAQREETQPLNINWDEPHVILSKADGSMITPYFNKNGGLEWHTKMGLTDVAGPVNDFANARRAYHAIAEFGRDNNVSVIFEWCSRKQKIVIDYPEDMLILLAARDNRTGEYWHYTELTEIGDRFDIPVIGHIKGKVTDPAAFLEAVRILKDEEGYVVRFDNGHMVKAKAEDYLRLHNMVDMLQLEKNVLSLVLSGSLDDTKPLMSDDSRVRVERYVEAIERGIATYATDLKAYADVSFAEVERDPKRFAIEKVNIDTVRQRDRSMLFRIANGADALEVVTEYVRKNTGTATRVDEIRDVIGGCRWDDFRDHSVVIDD